jgi:RNA recognition motif-containing protein
MVHVTIENGRTHMNNKLFVGGLSWDTTSEDLRHTFEAFCSVADAKVIADRDIGNEWNVLFISIANFRNRLCAEESDARYPA